MLQITKYIMLLKETKGRNAKIEKLEQLADAPGFKEVMKFIYSPYIRTGIAAAKINRVKKTVKVEDASWQAIIEYFSTHQTGRDIDIIMAKSFIESQPTEESKWVAEMIITQNLKVGIKAATLNSVYGADFIPIIAIMKAEKYKDYKNKVKGPFIVTEKHDGARRILIKEKGEVTLYTRSGHVDKGLVDIEEEAMHLPNNFVLDGEVLAIGEFDNSIALRQASNSIANSSGERHGVEFHVFDGMPLDEFKEGISKENAMTRKIMIGGMFKDESIKHLCGEAAPEVIDKLGIPYDFKHIKHTPILGLANSEEEVLSYAAPIWARSFEGVMLNTVEGKYNNTVDRSKEILKVKKVDELVLTVVDFLPGEGEFEGTLGAVVVDYKGNRVGVGSGFTLAQRHTIWANKQLYIGKAIEVDTFGESRNKSGGVSLNCPIFKRFVGEFD